MAKFTVRMEKRLSEALQKRAEAEGVSKNILIQREMGSYLRKVGEDR